ncbi:MAG: YbaB/EbfC family nucleoid-associated protein [Dehalococcoidia bacterium]|nr:YbaB/EbfC family nucleoid-associated protein [Dehalococcoidia bacterium]MDD5647550.1 YbaB/EbfC family nucleoid-associated protein [Dehalococcoidia bacterium]
MSQFNLRQIQELQAKMLKAQEELGRTEVEVTAGGGAIKIVINGHQQFQSITISPEVVNPEEVDFLQDLVLAACNEAVQKSQELATQNMSKLTGGLKIPGLM